MVLHLFVNTNMEDPTADPYEESVSVSLYPDENPTGELLITSKLRNAIGEELNKKEWTETNGKAKGKYVRGLLAEMPEESEEHKELARLLKSSQHTISAVYDMLAGYAEKERTMMISPKVASDVIKAESTVDWDDLAGWGEEDNVEEQTPSEDKMDVDEESKTAKSHTTSQPAPTPTPLKSESPTSDRVQEKLNELAKLFGKH